MNIVSSSSDDVIFTKPHELRRPEGRGRKRNTAMRYFAAAKGIDMSGVSSRLTLIPFSGDLVGIKYIFRGSFSLHSLPFLHSDSLGIATFSIISLITKQSR